MTTKVTVTNNAEATFSDGEENDKVLFIQLTEGNGGTSPQQLAPGESAEFDLHATNHLAITERLKAAAVGQGPTAQKGTPAVPVAAAAPAAPAPADAPKK